MKIIGRGYWYRVYDLGNGRVLKSEKNFLHKAYDTFNFEGIRPSVYFKLITKNWRIALIYKRLKGQIDLTLIGAPIFLAGIDYEQDKVEILENILKRSSEAENQKIIDMYIENIMECWRNGFSDEVYNFTINSGLDTFGKMILIDFNEVTFSKEDVLRSINSKRWLKSWSLGQIDSNLKSYYVEQMERKITSNSLEKNWT